MERGVIETDGFQNNSPRASIHYAMLSENNIEDGTNKSQSSSASQQILNEKKEKRIVFSGHILVRINNNAKHFDLIFLILIFNF